MARKSLKPQLNQIRAWVRQGRTDAWIAHQLEVSTAELRDFRRQHDLSAEDAGAASDVDLRDEIEAEVEAATEEEAARRAAEEAAERERKAAEEADDGDSEDDEESDGSEAEGRPRRRRRRGRRGGRGRSRTELEATFDHGETDGYGLWLDPAVQDNPAYSEHWAGQREVVVKIEADQIVITRAGDDNGNGNDKSDD